MGLMKPDGLGYLAKLYDNEAILENFSGLNKKIHQIWARQSQINSNDKCWDFKLHFSRSREILLAWPIY